MAYDKDRALRTRAARERLDDRILRLPPRHFGAIVALLSEIEETRGWWAGMRTGADRLLRERREKALRTSADASVRIGWTGLPLAETPAGPGPGAHREAERALASRAARYGAALREVQDRHAALDLSEETFRSLHAAVLRGLPSRDESPGRYRTGPCVFPYPVRRAAEWIALRPREPESVLGEMQVLAEWAADSLAARRHHPLFVAAGVVLEFLAVRPFRSANGRTSRLLTALLLLKSGYSHLPYASLEKAILDRRAEYYVALRKSQSTLVLPAPDVSAWLLAFLSALRAQGRELRALFEGLPDASRLSGNQARALALLERRGEVTTGLLMREIGLPRETAKQVLGRLVARNIAERAGAGRGARYRRSPFALAPPARGER